ncbi:fatty acid desaturase family protein [Phnomibacter ginsenosidimutans]|uniref:Acyl-CoA desaturase n=1 Tax=Phnomibacter ginsenosidimutans TaxID=2676868 RepID=A0A6I6GNG0_9BACT|nr:acyl-CoA desaturase [Phnomibacter ginsenosidimutans]QGW28472.1 acyl-CoA desaturase [Phnomibacter ginsenosidimutans]
MATPKFPHVTPSFHAVLKQRVNKYFEEQKKSTTGGWRILSKGMILVAALTTTYIVLMLVQMPVWVALSLSGLMGLLIATIGFNIMHDGGHGSFSKYAFVNKLAALTLNILGGSAFMWNQKHNVIHHAYTNVHDVDDDLDAGIFLRLSKHQPKLGIHKVQHFYFWFLYCLLYLFWIFYSDFGKYFSRQIGSLPLKKMSLKDHLSFWIGKLLFAAVFMIIPIYVHGFLSWMIGFLVMTMLSGFVLSIVFQLAHTVQDTAFPLANEVTGKMDDEWAVHQLKTTANFATRSRVISWLVGGLNFQVEHHLFPRISHIHYPAINKIVKEACAEFNVTYIEYRTLGKAVASHVGYLRSLGQMV